MDHRMRVTAAPILLLLLCSHCSTFIPGADGPISNQEALEGGNTTFHCDSSAAFVNDKLMLLVWYKDNSPIYSFDARIETEWSSDTYNTTGRLKANVQQQPTTLTVTSLREDDQAIYHCRVDFVLSQTRNVGVNLTVVVYGIAQCSLYKMFYLNNCVQVLPSQPFFLDEFGNKVEEKIGPYHEGDTLVLSCLVIGGRPPPRISWYSGDTLVDASDGESDIPRVKENELYLPLTRENAASLSCRASNTNLRPPIAAYLNIELYLPAQDVSIHLVSSTGESSVQAGRAAVVQCTARGSYPAPDLAWWLDRRHLTHHSNQSWSNATGVAVSFLELTPSVSDNEATLACVATNPAMAPSRGSKADLIKLNVTFSPLVEISRVGDGNLNEVVELDPLHLECEVKANPSAQTFIWYFNDSEIKAGGAWGDKIHSQHLVVEEATRIHSGRYSCAAANSIGETRAEQISITVLYPPECAGHGVTLIKESIHCNIRALPAPDTFFWHIQPAGFDMQQLTTGSPTLPLGQVTGPLVTHLAVTCEAGNGIASQEEPCKSTINLEHLRPPQPTQCDLAYEYEEFQVRCIPVENATHYEVSVWRMSTSNASLVLTRRASMGFGGGQALASGGAVTVREAGGGGNSWLVRGAVGTLREGDEAGASACNRYGCSRALLLRPTNTLLNEAAPPWWHLFLSRDVGISAGAVLLVVVFVATSALAVRAARRRAKPPPPVIQVLQLDEVARDYFDAIGEQKVHATCSVRSCSSGYSEYSGSELSSVVGAGVERSVGIGANVAGIAGLPPVDRRRKPRHDAPPPDVTLTLHRESAV